MSVRHNDKEIREAMSLKRYTWVVCDDCGLKIMKDLQDHERLIIKCPAYAYGECSVCSSAIHYRITVQQDTHEWLIQFTFKDVVAEIDKNRKEMGLEPLLVEVQEN